MWKWQLLEQPLSLYLDCWLTHWGRVMQICVRKPDHHWCISWFVASLVPRHYLNQCWHIVNWTIGRDFQWHSNQNETIFIKENGFENFVCKMATIWYQPQWVKNKYLDIFVTKPWVNPSHVVVFNISAYLYFTSFFWTVKTEAYLSLTVSIRAADDLVTQGARASAAMILTNFTWNNADLISSPSWSVIHMQGCLGLCPANERRRQSNTIPDWLSADLESALIYMPVS